MESIIERKREIAATYMKALSKIEEINLPIEMEWARNIYWMFGLVLKSGSRDERDDLITTLKEAGVDSRTFFCPMNQQPFLRKQPGFRDIDCPVADNLWDSALYLPSSYSLTKDEIKLVSNAIASYFTKVRSS
ncbi:MAG: DegT/DnrJ/EryC1/StrS family aminotransferase [Bacteroidetes bacterium]|nr:DegT/DnrJ/EryC1/StrS family aminotransferase [Bacteroidota bacterium]